MLYFLHLGEQVVSNTIEGILSIIELVGGESRDRISGVGRSLTEGWLVRINAYMR